MVGFVTDHVAEFPLLDQIHRHDAETRAQNAVQRRGCPATLQMSQHAGTCLLACESLNFLSHRLPCSAQSVFARGAGFLDERLACSGTSHALRHHNQRAVLTSTAAIPHHSGNVLVFKGDLGN